MKYLVFGIIGSFVLLAMVSCSIERELGRKYLKQHAGESVMISPAPGLYFLNSGAVADHTGRLSQEEQDSLAFFESTYLKNVSDSIFLTLFTNSLISNLEQLGFQVFIDQSSDLFLGSKRPAWIIQVSQLQLEEDYTPAFVYGYDDMDEEYIQEYRINSISLNSWIEVNRVNTAHQKKLLYLSGYIQDDTSAPVSLDYYRGDFYLSNPNDTLSLNRIYQMAASSGRKHAELLLDYFMNDFIVKAMPKSSKKIAWLHYDRIFNRLVSDDREQFLLLQP